MHHRPTVLLVHDDVQARVRFGTWLSAGGYRCLTADDSASALRFAGRTSPDVAVIDIDRQDRLWLAGRLRERANPIGVVLMSGDPSEAHAAAAARLGVAGIVIKPTDPAELLEAVERAAHWREGEEARVLDASEAVLAEVAKRHATHKRLVRSAATAAGAIEVLRGSFRGREPQLFGHAERVARGAALMGGALHLSSRELADVQAAALLHDLGKLALPEAVLLGEAPLGDAEMDALLDHHARTLDLVRDHPSLRGVITLLESVFARWDGEGVGDGPAGRAIPFGARIVAVADAFDAARANYAPDDTWAHQAAGRAAIARDAGTRLDPDLVRVYLHLLDAPSCS